MSGVYRYFDSPDGKDFFKKEYFLMKRAFPFGAFYAWYDIMGKTKPTGVLPITVRFFQTVSRPMVTLSLYNVTVYMSTRLRKKDDPINHMLGVFPAALYLTRYIPGPGLFILALPLSMVAFWVKQYKIWYPTYDFYREPSTHLDNRDNTIFADFYSYLSVSIKEKDWLTTDEAIKRGIVSSPEEAKEKKMTNYKNGQARGIVRTGDDGEVYHFY